MNTVNSETLESALLVPTVILVTTSIIIVLLKISAGSDVVLESSARVVCCDGLPVHTVKIIIN